MTAGAFELDGVTRLDQPLGLYRRGRLRDFGAGRRGRARSPSCSPPQPEVKPIGLGARDSLRLEAGLPLYGHDLDHDTTPVEADLVFALSKRRRAEGGFPGWHRIAKELADGPIRKRVGLPIEGRQPVREGAMVVDGEGNEVGKVTSGGFSPSLEAPIAMAYVPLASAEPGSRDLARVARQALHRDRDADAVRSPSLSPQGSRLMSVYYTKEHEWIRVEGDSATVGITDFAQGQLGDVVFVEVPEAGRALSQGRRGGGGRIGQGGVRRLCAGQRHGHRGQSGAGRRAALVNTDPEGEGWFFKLTLERHRRARRADERRPV